MKAIFTPLIFLCCAAAPLAAQSIAVYSEFQRAGPFGEIIDADRSPHPREIISPGVARNGYASFHVAITAPANTTYFLFAESNPPGILETRLYKEQFVWRNGAWIPDTLEETRAPRFGVIPDAQIAIPGQTTRDYLLDIHAPADAEVGRRVRVEVQMKVGRWIIYPMEIRILAAAIPSAARTMEPALAQPLEPALSADRFGDEALANYLARIETPPVAHPMTVRDVVARNIAQDMALALRIDAPDVRLLLWRDLTLRDLFAPHAGAEWYLHLRDLIYRRAR